MTSNFVDSSMNPRDRANYGFARVRDAAFDAVLSLWRRRQSEGWKQADLVRLLNRDRSWVSRNLRGPGNWTLRTFGELVEALDGEVEISVNALEDPLQPARNFDAYIGYSTKPQTKATSWEPTSESKKPKVSDGRMSYSESV